MRSAWRCFSGTLPVSWSVVGIGLVLTLVFSFFFTSVAANAIATTARNPGFRNDDADHHHFLCGLAQVRSIQHQRHVLRDGDCRDGVHGIVRIRPGDYRPQNRLLARLHAFGAGESEVPGRDRSGDRRGIHDRDAGADLPVRRSLAGRFAAGPGFTAGLDHEGAGGRLHEPPADRVLCCSAPAP